MRTMYIKKEKKFLTHFHPGGWVTDGTNTITTNVRTTE